MLNIPGRAGRTCEGPTRRELMRIGSLGLAGLHLPGFFLFSTDTIRAPMTASCRASTLSGIVPLSSSSLSVSVGYFAHATISSVSGSRAQPVQLSRLPARHSGHTDFAIPFSFSQLMRTTVGDR